MIRVLLTAYGPYDHWKSNASWMVLQEVTRLVPSLESGHPGLENLELVTRLYPVDFAELADRMSDDLTSGIDIALHMGQAPGQGKIALEQIGLNLACDRGTRPEDARQLVVGGPVAYQSALPLSRWAKLLRAEGIPAEVSHHAGGFLCNAAHYLAHHLAAERSLPTRATFLHLPLDPSQVLDDRGDLASLPVEITAHGVRLILEDIASGT